MESMTKAMVRNPTEKNVHRISTKHKAYIYSANNNRKKMRKKNIRNIFITLIVIWANNTIWETVNTAILAVVRTGYKYGIVDYAYWPRVRECVSQQNEKKPTVEPQPLTFWRKCALLAMSLILSAIPCLCSAFASSIRTKPSEIFYQIYAIS